MNTIKIQRVAVCGAGTMGAQIAGFLADLGHPVDLFDLGGKAQQAWDGLVKAGGCTFRGRQAITPRVSGRDDAALAQADLVVEAVFEDAAAKAVVNDALERHARPGCILATNTSGLSIDALAAGRSGDFRHRYLGLHLFNPLKHLALAELTPGRDTDRGLFHAFAHWVGTALGKGVVLARDTPNFIGNRVGGWALYAPFHLAPPGLSPMDIDRVYKVLFGWEPLKTWDLVGLALARPVAANVYDRAPDDPCRELFQPAIPWVEALVAKGCTGRGSRAQSGFFALGPKRQKLMSDLASGTYVPATPGTYPSLAAAEGARFPESLGLLLAGDDPAADFARRSFFGLIVYAASMVGTICDDTLEIDRALRWGFAWPRGPFELAQAYGLARVLEGAGRAGSCPQVPAWLQDLAASGGQLYPPATPPAYWSVRARTAVPVPRVEDGVYPAELLKAGTGVLFRNDEAAVLDLSTAAAPMCLVAFTARGHAAGPGTLVALHRALDWAEERRGAVLVGHDGRDFCPGADLRGLLERSEAGQVDAIAALLRDGQELTQRLTYSPALTVAVPHGFTLGGGSEIALGCKRRVVNARVTWGQPEINPGVVPAWGGCMRLLRTMMQGLQTYYLWGEYWTREVAGDHLDPVWRLIAWAEMSRDGHHAQEMGFLAADDVVVPAQGPGQPFVLARARRLAEATLQAGFRVPTPFVFNLPGRALRCRFQMLCEQGALGGIFPKHNARVATAVAHILCGGEARLGEPVTEQQLLDLEREAFLELVMTREAQQAMRRVLKL